MAKVGSSRYVYGIYVSGRRVGPKYLEREQAVRDARSFRNTYPGRPPSIKVKRILDR